MSNALAHLKDVSEYQIDPNWTIERQILCQLINEGVTRQKIADETGLNRKYVSQYSNGKCYEKVDDVESSLRRYFQLIGRWPDDDKPIGFKTSADQIGIITSMSNRMCIHI